MTRLSSSFHLAWGAFLCRFFAGCSVIFIEAGMFAVACSGRTSFYSEGSPRRYLRGPAGWGCSLPLARNWVEVLSPASPGVPCPPVQGPRWIPSLRSCVSRPARVCGPLRNECLTQSLGDPFCNARFSHVCRKRGKKKKTKKRAGFFFLRLAGPHRRRSTCQACQMSRRCQGCHSQD